MVSFILLTFDIEKHLQLETFACDWVLSMIFDVLLYESSLKYMTRDWADHGMLGSFVTD